MNSHVRLNDINSNMKESDIYEVRNWQNNSSPF